MLAETESVTSEPLDAPLALSDIWPDGDTRSLLKALCLPHHHPLKQSLTHNGFTLSLKAATPYITALSPSLTPQHVGSTLTHLFSTTIDSLYRPSPIIELLRSMSKTRAEDQFPDGHVFTADDAKMALDLGLEWGVETQTTVLCSLK
eukprot:TRINITY_DN44831_c0_g1_i1.p1 TRINITY_DN44831_c0_g1~~TRINITY_DN44831_c0_g1_i1.p1  ORF type:complete len:164 (+),score=23.80 TRINITY_DN44831_c0_g1_i1:52-492(+)